MKKKSETLTKEQRLKELSQKYSNACAIMGDLIIKKEALEDNILELKDEIKELQKLAKDLSDEE